MRRTKKIPHDWSLLDLIIQITFEKGDRKRALEMSVEKRKIKGKQDNMNGKMLNETATYLGQQISL